MNQTSNRNDGARRPEPVARAVDPLAAELKPSVLGAPVVQLLPGGSAGLPRFGAGFVEADAFGRDGEAPLVAAFDEDEFEDEEEEFDDEEDEFGEEEEEEDDDEFDDEEDDDEFDDEEDEAEEETAEGEEELEEEDEDELDEED